MNILNMTYLDGYFAHPVSGKQVRELHADTAGVGAITIDPQSPTAITVSLTDGHEVVYPFQRFAIFLPRSAKQPQSTGVQSVTDVDATGNALVEAPRRRRRRRTKQAR